MKTFSVRIEIEIKAQNDDEAKKFVELYLREQPRFENSKIGNVSLYNSTDHRKVSENL